MRIVPAATPVCSASVLDRELLHSDRPDKLRRCARSGFPEPRWVANVRARSRSDPCHRRDRLRRLQARRRTAGPRAARSAPSAAAAPGRATRARATCSRATACPRRSRASTPPTTSSTRWARAATSPPRTARRRSTSPRRRRTPASSASSTSAGSAREDSEHLRSRHEVAQLLRARLGDRLVYVRAAMIIGPGSASYDILEHLVKRLPVMIVPQWLDTKTQPIALADVVHALADLARARRRAGRAAARRRRGPDLS